jgi:branched-chain amino acid transport system ATP-binding protein
MSTETILEVDELSKRFGGVTAVADLSFAVEAGSTTGLIGPNGAGKTTAFNIINGMIAEDSGAVRFRDEEITDLKTTEIARKGIGRTFQDSELFPELTVEENLELAALEEKDIARVDELLELINLTEKRDDLAMDLSYGQSKLVGIARAFMLDPDLILLDEPLSGINPSLQTEVLAMADRLQTEFGTTYLIIEHDMDVVMNACDRVLVMESGSLLAEGAPKEIQHNEEVRDAYFGKEVL